MARFSLYFKFSTLIKYCIPENIIFLYYLQFLINNKQHVGKYIVRRFIEKRDDINCLLDIIRISKYANHIYEKCFLNKFYVLLQAYLV